MYGEVEVQHHAFLTSVSDVGTLSASRCGRISLDRSSIGSRDCNVQRNVNVPICLLLASAERKCFP
jgi:hypothetical protein